MGEKMVFSYSKGKLGSKLYKDRGLLVRLVRALAIMKK